MGNAWKRRRKLSWFLVRFEREGVAREEKAESEGAKMVMPWSVSLAWFWKVWMVWASVRWARKAWKGPARERRSVTLTKGGEGEIAGGVAVVVWAVVEESRLTTVIKIMVRAIGVSSSCKKNDAYGKKNQTSFENAREIRLRIRKLPLNFYY